VWGYRAQNCCIDNAIGRYVVCVGRVIPAEKYH
jgi:hypothetical protein